MKVQMMVNYMHVGNYDLDKLSDETLGALTRGMLLQARDANDRETEVNWKVAKLDNDGDEIPF